MTLKSVSGNSVALEETKSETFLPRVSSRASWRSARVVLLVD